MPSCAPNYANVGYKEYFNAAAPGVQYSNYANLCIQTYCADSRVAYYGNTGAGGGGICNQGVCYQTCTNFNQYGTTYPANKDDCSQYSNYSNCTNYARNGGGAGTVLPALSLDQSVIDGITDIPTSITAVTHLRDKLATLISLKLRQDTVDDAMPSTISDATFNDSNSATAEITLATQYNALKTKMDAFWNALKAGGTTLTTPSSDAVKSSGDTLFKNSILALKTDLVTIANACSQTYANYQNGYAAVLADTYTNSVATYTRTTVYRDAFCSQLVCTNTGGGCGQYNYSNYNNCTNTVWHNRYMNTQDCWNYANHSNHSNHSNYRDTCRRDN